MPPASDADRRTDKAALKRGLAYCASLGITSIHNMDGNFYQLELLDALRQDGDLICRVQVPWHQKNVFAPERVDEAVEMRARYNDDMLYSGRVKVFMDGVIESMTALMLDDYPNHPGERGFALFSAEEFNAVAARADKHGLQIGVHAIGDAAVRRTLDGYAYARKVNGTRDSRHRIEHIEVIDPADIPRLKELGVVALAAADRRPWRPRRAARALPRAHRRQAALLLCLADIARRRRPYELLLRLAGVAAQSLARHAVGDDAVTDRAQLPAAAPDSHGHARRLHL